MRSIRLSLLVALAGLALGFPAAAQTTQAVRGPLHLIGGGADVSDWTSAPTPTAPGVVRLWWWKLFHPAAETDGFDRSAWLYEVHCEANQLRHVRQELYAGDQLLRGHDSEQPLHSPVDRWADPQVMARACGQEAPSVSAPDVAVAATHFRRR